MVSLQAALPASYYVDDDHWRRERDSVLFHEWFCAGRLSAHGLDVGSAERTPCGPVGGVLLDLTGLGYGTERVVRLVNTCERWGMG